MAVWLIRVIGKPRKEIDKHLLVQALVTLGQQLWDEEQAKAQQPPDAGSQAEEATA